MKEISAELPSATEDDGSVGRLLAIGLTTRLFIDTGVQIFFPFLPIVASGLGMTTVSLGRLVSLRSLMGLFSPLFGSMADRRGYRFAMRLGLLLAGLGYLGVAVSSSVLMAAPSMVIAGLGSFSFVPTLQAYLSNRLPYHRRARGIGILEYAWALSGIVGLFLVGLLLGIASWRAPFFIIGGGLLLASLLYGFLPTARQGQTAGTAPALPSSGTWRSILRFFALKENASSAYAVIVTSSLLMFGAFNLFISYGTWLFDDYGLNTAALGRVGLIMGIVDLVGSVLVSVISDRFGKRRSVITGSVIACIGFWSLPIFRSALIPAMAALVAGRGAFEFAIVANMTLLSEQVPSQRAKLMTMGAAFALVSSSLAGLTGPWLLEQYGISGVAIVSGSSTLGGILMLLWRVAEPDAA